MHYTPNRFTEGYGLSRGAVEKFIQAKIDLLVTIDCGISNVQEIDLAKRHGVNTVVIDHHIPHDLPPADAIVNPAQEGCPFQEHKLCAAGLVWMVLIILRQRALVRWGEPKTPLPDPKTFLDLAALGTICDMVPLVGLNRVLAYRGIEALQASARPGLNALREVCGLSPKKKLTAGHTSFLLGPRINAAGRLEDGRLAFELLTTTNELKAKALAKRIDELNSERRTVEESVKQSCLKQLRGDPVATAQPALAVFGESFHAGVIGIVAQRLVEEFHRPAAVMAPGETIIKGERKPVIKGSVRSISGFHVAEALESLSALLVSHGGHREAGGFTVLRENLEAFQQGFIRAAGERLTEEHLARTVYADAEVTLGEVDYGLVDELVKLSPFGVGNPSPVLITRGLSLEAVTPFGENSVRLRFSDGKHFADGVLWRARSFERLRRGERVNIAYQPEISSYQGLSSVQLNIKELW
jgi:single-stranded-DNA-specific exonuclease